MRKALKTVLCVALVLALAVVIALRVLPPMNAPAQSAVATPTPAAAAAVVPTPFACAGRIAQPHAIPFARTGQHPHARAGQRPAEGQHRQLGAHARQCAKFHRRGRAGGSGRAREWPVF